MPNGLFFPRHLPVNFAHASDLGNARCGFRSFFQRRRARRWHTCRTRRGAAGRRALRLRVTVARGGDGRLTRLCSVLRVRAWLRGAACRLGGAAAMVIMHVKKTDELQFLFETPVASKVDDTVEELVEIWNMQIQIRRLIDSLEELALYGHAMPVRG